MKKMVAMIVMAWAGWATASMATEVTSGDASAGKAKSAVCAACHGADGNSATDAFPKLAGQHATYMTKQLVEFKSGVRANAVMAPMVAALSEQDMADISAYFASQKVTPGAVSEDLVELGKQIYRGGNKASKVPACMACHGPNGSGMPAAGWPALSGQYPAYLVLQLKAFAAGERSNDANSMMRDIAARMTEEEMAAAAAYASGL